MKIKTRLILVVILLTGLALGNLAYNPTYEISSPDGISTVTYQRHDNFNPELIASDNNCNHFKADNAKGLNLSLCNEVEE